MILTDRHHADLLYSTQRLFEDRLNVGPVCVPVGYEWWNEGYWRFGEVFGDQRLADQYLAPNPPWTQCGSGVYLTYDPAHPDRRIWGVSLDRVRGMSKPSIVMPSVQENAPGFKRLADEIGATFAYQLGNTGQYIDWSLDPLILSSAEMPFPEGQGVVYHQEIDSDEGGAFAWSDPAQADPRIVRNFVNAFNRLPGYGQFLEAEAALPEWTFTSHGHEGRDGDINPVAAMGALMQTAGWGWHDKPVGDGFGHVIHAWAAVGRPLIGHASYYRGRMAEVFWQDGVTCLDLDARSALETLDLMRCITADLSTHERMCHSIREAFNRVVDYDSEAQAVAGLLGLSG